MRKIISSGFIAIAFLIGANVNAQEKAMEFGVKAGVNLSNFGGDITDTKAKVGFNAGVTLDYALTPDLYLMTGLEFTTKGAKREYSLTESGVNTGYKVTNNPMYLQMPIHLGYKMTVTEGVRVVFQAGPYIAYGIGGKTKTEAFIGSQTAEEKVDFFGSNAAKAFDFGVGGGVGLEFGKIGVNLGYDFGLANISRESNYKVKNQNAYLTLGYRF